MTAHQYVAYRMIPLFAAISNIGLQIYLSKRGRNGRVLLQLEELADEILFCETQRLQLTEDLLKYLQKQTPSN